VANVDDTEGEIIIYWGASTDNLGVAGYEVFRDGVSIGSTPYPFFADQDLALNSTYTYSVQAFDGSGNTSETISTLAVTLDEADTTAPPEPTGLNAKETDINGATVIELDWNQSDIQDVAGFIILRNDETLAQITSDAFTDSNVLDGIEYCYQIITFDAAGNESLAAPVAPECEIINGSDDLDPNAPVAVAGNDQTIILGQSATVDGSGSTDANNDSLSYLWSVISQPVGGNATFDDDSTAQAVLSTSAIGTYEIQLTVNDGTLSNSATLSLTVNDGDQDSDGLLSSLELALGLNPNAEDSDNNGTTDGNEDSDNDGFSNIDEVNNGSDPNNAGSTPSPTNNSPNSNAGNTQTVNLGQTITLDGSASSDPDGNAITYQWSITSQPNGAVASINDATIAQPVLTVDTEGTYSLELTVSDGSLSDTDIVTITVNPVVSPLTSNAGSDQTLFLGQTAALDGSASTSSYYYY